jgi:stage III sporulation protein SpoIIIAA
MYFLDFKWGDHIKKRITILILVIISTIVVISVILNKYENIKSKTVDIKSDNGESVSVSNIIDINDVEEIKLITLPSPPKYKTVIKKVDIEKIINKLNSINYVSIEQENVKGWVFRIIIKGSKGYDISFLGNNINCNGVRYSIGSSTLIDLKELYNLLNYEEQQLVK